MDLGEFDDVLPSVNGTDGISCRTGTSPNGLERAASPKDAILSFIFDLWRFEGGETGKSLKGLL